VEDQATKFLGVTPEDLAPYLTKIKDKTLKETLPYGVHLCLCVFVCVCVYFTKIKDETLKKTLPSIVCV